MKIKMLGTHRGGDGLWDPIAQYHKDLIYVVDKTIRESQAYLFLRNRFAEIVEE